MSAELFLVNTELSPRPNWTTLGPPFARAMANHGGYEVVTPRPLSIRSLPRMLNTAMHRRRPDTVVWMQLSSRPEWPLLVEALAARPRRRSAYVIDAWPYALDKIGRVARLLRLDPCFVAFAEGCEELTRRFPDLNFVHLPFGVDTSVFRGPPADQEKDIFAYWMGRRTPALHVALTTYCEARGLKYVTSSGGEITDPAELGKLVGRSRYFVVTSPDVDHPARAGGFSPLVMRYLEGLAGGARLLGTVPRSGEFEAMLPADAICLVKGDGSDLEQKLDEDQRTGPSPERMAKIGAAVREEHSWAVRAVSMLEHLR